MQLRIRQLESAQQRTLLIVGALTRFYTSTAAFVANNLISLVGAVLVATQTSAGLSCMNAFPNPCNRRHNQT